MTAWISLIPYDQSEGYLRTLYDRVKGPDDRIDNVMKAHSLQKEGYGHKGVPVTTSNQHQITGGRQAPAAAYAA